MNVTSLVLTYFNTNTLNDISYYDLYDYDFLSYYIDELFKYKLANSWSIAVIIVIVESCIGLLGNTLSLIVWNIGKRSSNLACSTYFKILAASDILTLISGIVGIVLPHFFDIMQTDYCAVLGILEHVLIPLAPQLSAWIIVSISIERTSSLCFPFRFRTKGFRLRAWTACFVIILVFSGINYNIFLCSVFVADRDLGITMCYCTDSNTNETNVVSVAWSLCILPFVAVTFCNIIIAIKLYLERKSNPQLNSTNRHNKLQTFTKLCIGTAILHCVSVLPVAIMLYYLGRLTSTGGVDGLNFEDINEVENYLTYITTLLAVFAANFFLNNSLNCLLYCFAGTNFRKDLKVLVIRCIRKFTPRDQLI